MRLLAIIWLAGMALLVWWVVRIVEREYPDPGIFLVVGAVGATVITIALMGEIIEALLRQRE